MSRLWLKKSYPYRIKALNALSQRSGFSKSQSEAMLDALFSELTNKKLWRLLKSEIRNPLFLDGFQKDILTGQRIRAQGPRLITHIFPGNVPNPAIVGFILGMLVKAKNVGKVSNRDPGFLDIYLDSLCKHDPQLGKMNILIGNHVGAYCIRPRPWPMRGVFNTPLQRWIERSDLVVAYGNDETLSEIRKIVPAGTQFMGYGHRVSFSLYTREALTKKNLSLLAKRAARDVWMMDQRGCLSPTVIYVEKGGEISPLEFARNIKIGLVGAGSKPAPPWTVLFDEKPGKFPLSGNGRIIFFRSFKKIEQVYRELSPMKKSLQAAALETSSPRRMEIAERLAVLGVNRVCRAGRMQFPPITWHHDGKLNLANWVTWTDLEL